MNDKLAKIKQAAASNNAEEGLGEALLDPKDDSLPKQQQHVQVVKEVKRARSN